MPIQAEPADDANIAKNLADMLRAARQVISNNQSRINDPNLGDKGLTGQVVLQQAVEIFKKTTRTDPASIDPTSRFGRLMHAQMDAIVEVTDANQATINAKGVGFKAFIPAVFARLVNECREPRPERSANQGNGSRTARKEPEVAARPVGKVKLSRGKLLREDWPRGQAYAAEVDMNGRKGVSYDDAGIL